MPRRKSYAIVAVAQIGPALRANLEHRPSLRRVHVCWPAHMPELHLVSRLVGRYSHGKRHFQNLVALVPVDVCREVQNASFE